MPNKTTNYGLTKPLKTENYDIEIQNSNMDIIDKGLIPYVGDTSGTPNTYTVSAPNITKLATGMAVSLRINVDSTGPSTLNISNLGAIPIKKTNGTDVTNLKVGGIYTLRYDGTNFILQGEGASGNATASDLLLDKTATTDAGEITGTMPNNGAVVVTPGTTDKPITKGYHDGNGYVQGDADLISSNIKAGANIFGVPGSPMVMDTSVGDAVAGDMLAGRKACVDGAVITGTIPVKTVSEPAFSYDATSVADRIYIRPAEGYYDGVSAGATVQLIDANFNSENIKAGVSIFGKLGTMSAGKKFASGTVTTSGTNDTFNQYLSGTTFSMPFIKISNLGITFWPRILVLMDAGTPHIIYLNDGFVANYTQYKILRISEAKFYYSTSDIDNVLADYYNKQYTFLAWE